MRSVKEDLKLAEVLLFLHENENDPNNQEQVNSKRKELDQILRDIDRIHVREFFNAKLADYIEDLLKEDNEFFKFENIEDQIDAGINLNFANLAEYASNYYRLLPPFVRQGVEIPEKIQKLYAESRYCFIFGQNNAAIVLSRAIIETSLRNKIGLPESKEWTAGVVLQKAIEFKIICDEDIAWIARKVIKLAGNILHRAKNATKSECLNALDHTKKVLEYLFG